jgi:hypothetical protein
MAYLPNFFWLTLSVSVIYPPLQQLLARNGERDYNKSCWLLKTGVCDTEQVSDGSSSPNLGY